MSLRMLLVLATFSLACAPPATAVDFGVMESADPVARGHYKFEAYPLATRRTANQEDFAGVNFAPGFEWNAALDFAHDEADLTSNRAGLDASYLSAYAVPGAQYRVRPNVDLIGEIGLGLNDASNDYASAGLSLYFR